MTDNKINSYALSREWFNFCFANPEKVKPNHTALYFFAIEHCNRLGWKTNFGFPSQMCMEAIGIKNWRTYSKTLSDIVDWGFLKMVETSKNQYSSNIVAIVYNTKAQSKALDKALQKHSTKQRQSIVSIDKQLNKEQLNNEQGHRSFLHLSISKQENQKLLDLNYTQYEIDSVYDKIENYKKNTSYNSLFLTAQDWLKRDIPNRNSSDGKKFTYWMQDRGTVKDQKEKIYLRDKSMCDTQGWEFRLISER